MKRYMQADLNRILKRIPRWILIACFAAGFVIVDLMIDENTTVYSLVSILERVIPILCPLLGLAEMIFVYGEDFRAKTMQVAIGTGVSRRHVILAKWQEVVILSALDMVIMLAVMLAGAAVEGLIIKGDPLVDILILLLFALIQIIFCSAATMIFIFLSQNGSAGNLIYLLFDFGIVKTILTLVLDIEKLKPWHLSKYLPSVLIETARSRLLVNTFSPELYLGIAAWCAFFFLITWLIFHKRELEF